MIKAVVEKWRRRKSLVSKMAGKTGKRWGTKCVMSACCPLGNMMRRGEGRLAVGSERSFTRCGEMTFTWLPSSKSTGTGWSEMRAVDVRRCLRWRQGGSDLGGERGSGDECGEGEGGVRDAEDVPVILFCREVSGTRWILPANENPLVGFGQCRLGRLGCHIEIDHTRRCRMRVTRR